MACVLRTGAQSHMARERATFGGTDQVTWENALANSARLTVRGPRVTGSHTNFGVLNE